MADVTTVILGKLQSLKKWVEELAQHADDLENRRRRKNIHIIGVREGAEGNGSFFESCLPELFNIKIKAGQLKVERGHCTVV